MAIVDDGDDAAADREVRVRLPEGILGDGFDPREPSEAMIAAWLRPLVAHDPQDVPRLGALLRARLIAGHAAIEHAWASAAFAGDMAAAAAGRGEVSGCSAAKDAVHAAERRSWEAALERMQAEWEARLASAHEARTQLNQALEEARSGTSLALDRARTDVQREVEARLDAKVIQAHSEARQATDAADARARLAKDEADATVRLAKDDAEARVAAARRDSETVMARLAELTDVRITLSALGTHVSGLSTATHSAEVRRLDGALADARREIERLRGTNHVKGALGEAVVMDAVRASAAFADWAFADTSARGGQSDFHMTSPCGRHIVAFEVKNKTTVTCGDVDKSTRDVAELTERYGCRLAGYAFVSLCTRNIPRKGGGLRIDRIAGVPVLWFGTEAFASPDAVSAHPEAMAELVRATRLLLDVRAVLGGGGVTVLPYPDPDAPLLPDDDDGVGVGGGGGGGGAVAALVEAHKTRADAADAQCAQLLAAINAQLGRLAGLRKTANALQDVSATLRRHAASLATDVDAGYRFLEAELRGVQGTPDDGTDRSPTATVPPEDGIPATVGAPCGRQFKSSRAVNGHMASCTVCKTRM